MYGPWTVYGRNAIIIVSAIQNTGEVEKNVIYLDSTKQPIDLSQTQIRNQNCAFLMSISQVEMWLFMRFELVGRMTQKKFLYVVC